MITTESKLATVLRDILNDPIIEGISTPALARAEEALAAHQAQDGDVSYEVWQDDMSVAGAQGPGALQEAMHYAAQYAFDGPVQIYKVIRERVEYPLAPPTQQDGDAKDATLKWALNAGGVLADWCNKSGDALQAMMAAYERRVRSLCTPEEIGKEPWRCAEFIVAESVLREKPTWSYVIPQAAAPPQQEPQL